MSPSVALLGLAFLWGAAIWQWRIEWNFNPLYSYGWTVPPLIAYLAWRESEFLPAPSRAGPGAGVIGLLLAAGLLPLRLLLEANPDWRLLPITLGVIVAGVTLVFVHRAGGWPWTRAFLPIAGLVLLAIPWTQQTEYLVIQRLTRVLTNATVELLNFGGIPAVQRGNVIEVPSGLVGVDEACSGIRSLQATLMLAGFLGQFLRLRLAHRLLLFPVGLCVASVTNLARTLFLAAVAAGTGKIERWHDPAGFMVLGVCFAVMWGIGSRWRGPDAVPSRVPWRFAPARWGVALALWVVFVEGSNAAWYSWHERERGLRSIAPWKFDWPVGAMDYEEIKIPEDERIVLRADEQRVARWREPDGARLTAFFVRWEASRAAAQLAHNHNPQVCYTANGHEFAGARGIVQIDAPQLGRTLPFAVYLFAVADRPLFVFRCLDEDGAVPGAAPRGADYGIGARLLAAREGRRNLGQRSLELAISAPSLDLALAVAAARQTLAARIVAGN